MSEGVGRRVRLRPVVPRDYEELYALAWPALSAAPDEATLAELEGYDSLGVVELAAFVEERWGVDVPEAMLPSLVTIADWHDLVITRLAAQHPGT